MLAACASPEEPTPEQARETAPLAQDSEQNKSASDELAKLPPVDMQPVEHALREGLPGPQAPGPERLIGLAAGDIQRLFGAPDFKRRDPPAEIWQYRKDGCMLDFFLYQGKDASFDYLVTHVEARSRSVEKVSGTDCLLEALKR